MASPRARVSRQIPLDVPPLNSMPSVDPPLIHPMDRNEYSDLNEVDANGTVGTATPSLVFLQSAPTEEEVKNVLSVTKNGVLLGGSAAMGMMGPLLGKMDIGEDENSFLFRVALPGVARGENDFSCDVAPDGLITIRGYTTTGEKTVYREGMKFEMITHNLCPTGNFSVSFKLPGPVDSQQMQASFGLDGILDGIVKKKDT